MRQDIIPEPTLLLLRFAVKKDNLFSKAIARNYAVIACLSYAERLHEISKEPKPERMNRLAQLLKSEQLPGNFIVLVAASLRTISNRINEMIRSKNTTNIPLTTDFDAHALKAFGLVFSEIMWLPAEKDDFSGPSVEKCLLRLSAKPVYEIWSLFTKHYLGNILQHYFEEAEIRRKPELRDVVPEDEEEQLRQRDADAIARYCLEKTVEKNNAEMNVFDYTDLMADVLREIVKK